jgi:arylsulfatase A-like enzyme
MTTYLDLMPTFLRAAGVSYPAEWRGKALLRSLEGRDILPLLQGEDLPPPENFYWNLYGHFAVLHEGRWKLLANATYDEKKEREQAPPTLAVYDLLSDPAETKNLGTSKAELASALLADYELWATEHGVIPYYKVLDAYRRLRAAHDKG